jgi:hypothetical protein
MQHPHGVAVVATHLAGIDRRALSQAWYSALHLAERAAPARRGASAAPSPGAAAKVRGGCRDESGRGAPVAAPRAVREPHPAPFSGRSGAHLTSAERRAPRCELARRIEHGVARRRTIDGGVAFAVRTGGARVHVLVRCCGARTRIVAVCSPPLRERVERALAQARFALAGRGAAAEVA